VGRYQKDKTNLDFTEARDSEWQWHQLGYMQVCTSLQADNHASTPPLSFFTGRMPSCHPTNSVKALNAYKDTQLTKTCTISDNSLMEQLVSKSNPGVSTIKKERQTFEYQQIFV